VIQNSQIKSKKNEENNSNGVLHNLPQIQMCSWA
jgi:hypothetical protein